MEEKCSDLNKELHVMSWSLQLIKEQNRKTIWSFSSSFTNLNNKGKIILLLCDRRPIMLFITVPLCNIYTYARVGVTVTSLYVTSQIKLHTRHVYVPTRICSELRAAHYMYPLEKAFLCILLILVIPRLHCDL